MMEYTENDINHLKTIEKNFKSNNLIFIKNDENYGFAKGNNIGISFVLENLNADYVLLLNNDTEVKPNFLTELIKIAQKDRKNGIIGYKLLNAYNPHIIDSAEHVIKWRRVVDRGHGEVDNG